MSRDDFPSWYSIQEVRWLWIAWRHKWFRAIRARTWDFSLIEDKP